MAKRSDAASRPGDPHALGVIMPPLLGGEVMKTMVLAVLLCATILAAAPAPPQNAFSPDQIKFGPVPPVLAPGAQLAVLEGDPMGSSGDFTIRLKMPDGYRIPPHWHPKRENVTVISGSFKLGMGDTFDPARMNTLPVGSFGYLDPDMHHYGMAVGETVVQVHGSAPFQINYVNPSDDPSMKK
jgi:quercetin dioxygenase-like cupin family protein